MSSAWYGLMILAYVLGVLTPILWVSADARRSKRRHKGSGWTR